MFKCGIICEYDPFHNGHKYHLQKTKELTGADIICIMSGDFTQRARPAYFDKSLRAEAALKCGADAVLEIPVVYSTAPAEIFAYGAVKILSQIKDLKYISFGVETDDLDILKKIAVLQADEPQDMKDMMRALLKQGLSYPNCIAEASAVFLKDFDNSKQQNGSTDYGTFKNNNEIKDIDNQKERDKTYILDILSSPNNVLAIEYLKAITRLKLDIQPVFIKRTDGGFKSRELAPPYASATAIRSLVESGTDYSDFVPFDLGKPTLDINLYDSILRLSLLQNNIPPAEGLEKKLKKAAEKHAHLSEIIEAVKSKRYTYSRINRLILCTTSGISNEFLKYKGDFFYKVLGIRNSFKNSLKDLGRGAIIKITDKPDLTQTAEELLLIDKKASDIYSVITKASASRFYNKLKIV